MVGRLAESRADERADREQDHSAEEEDGTQEAEETPGIEDRNHERDSCFHRDDGGEAAR